MSEIKIGIIGYGVVGKAVANTLIKEYEIVRYDKYVDYESFDSLKSCNFIFITVPTPFDCSTDTVDDSAIIASLGRLEELEYSNCVIIKSTVPPGSCSKYKSKFDLSVVFNPEFLRESKTPNEDFQNQDTVVIGTENLEIFESVKRMYQLVLTPQAKYYHTSIIEAEMIKCAQNTMLASRIALANMIFDACQEHNIEYNMVREIAFDNFEILGPHMVQVPGPDGNRGFGGKCLVKDIKAFSTICKSDLVENIISYNEGLRDDLHKFLENFDKT